MNNAIEQERTEILDNFKEIDRQLSELPEGRDKTEIEKLSVEMKREATGFIPEMAALRDELKPSPDHAFEGLKADDEFTREIADQANNKLHQIAEKAGLDPQLVQMRYDDPTAPPIAVADRWMQSDVSNLAKGIREREGVSGEEASEQAQIAVKAAHDQIKDEFNIARRQINGYEARKRSLVKDYQAYRSEDERDNQPVAVDEEFSAKVRSVLVREQINQLEQGDYTVLANVSKNPQHQLDMAEKYLVTERSLADAQRQSELDESLSHLRSASEAHHKQLEKEKLDKGRHSKGLER